MSDTECDLHLGDGDAEPIEDFKRRMGTATEQLLCVECGRPIAPGVEHEIVTGDCDGEPFEAHVCMDCYHIAKGLSTEGRMYGQLWTELEEHGGENGDGAFEHFTSGCLTRVETASAKAYLAERFRKWKQIA